MSGAYARSMEPHQTSGATASIVGREAEREALEGFLDAAIAGPAALILRGEAGIGKTTVWRFGVDEARERGFRVLV